VGKICSGSIQIGSEAHPASSTMGTGTLPGVKQPGHSVDHSTLFNAEVKKIINQSSSIYIWYLHQIHTRFNRAIAYQICHKIIQKYTIYLPYLSNVEVKEIVDLYLSLCAFMACCMVNITIMLIAGSMLVVSW